MLRHLKTSLRSRLTSDHARQKRSSVDSLIKSQHPSDPTRSVSNSPRSSIRYNRANSAASGSVGSIEQLTQLSQKNTSPTLKMVPNRSPPSPAALTSAEEGLSSPQIPECPSDVSASKPIDPATFHVAASSSCSISPFPSGQALKQRESNTPPGQSIQSRRSNVHHDHSCATDLSPSTILPVLYVPIIGFELSPPSLARSTIALYPTSDTTPIMDIAVHLILLPLHTGLAIINNLPFMGNVVPLKQRVDSRHRSILSNATQDALGLMMAGTWKLVAQLLSIIGPSSPPHR